PLTFEWFDRPSVDRLRAALALLESLGAVRGGRVTPLGDRMKRLPLHPRLARMLVHAGGARPIALACALLSERRSAPPHPATTTRDLLSAVDDERALPPHVRDVASRLEPLARDPHEPAPRRLDDESFRRAIFAGYPDRVARRRAPGSPRFLLTSGHGAALRRDRRGRDAEFIVAVDVHARRSGENAEATIRIASAIDVAWLRHQIHGTHGLQPDGHAGSALTRVVDHEYDAVSGRVRAIERERYGAIVLTERSAKVDAEV